MMSVDSLEFDIKRALVTSPNSELQWHILRNELLQKYSKYDESTFNTLLHRKLKKLIITGDLKKKSLGHQEVYYRINKKHLSTIKDELDRTFAHKLFDDIWKSFTPEQRKREMTNLLGERGKVINILQETSLNLLNFAKEEAESLKNRLENPTEEMKSKYSSEDMKKISEQVESQISQMKQISENLTLSKNKITEQDVIAEIDFLKEFKVKVVDPNYSGNFKVALKDLMKKALEKEEKKNEK